MYANKDIYDEHGRLLLAEGQEITDKNREKLKRYHILEENKIEPEKRTKNIEIKIDIKKIHEKLNLSNKEILDYPASITSKILFESKTKPWWLIVNTLSNYISWVYTHSINVSLISLMIAIKVGYSTEALYEIALGSILHDVGKLMIPKSIIQKNSTLDNREMLLIKQHCDLGISIIEGFDLPKACTAIIQQHHERNNGSGYPFGLKEDEIHQYAKIVMIADVVDAITSYRPYRPAKEMPEALKSLKKVDNMFSKNLIAVLEYLLQ